jgi:hypothetical protein
MKKLFWILFLAAAALAANTVMTTDIPVDAHPQPPTEYEFYWDDGNVGGGWSWYTGGNYWAVQFDEVKTGGDPGVITLYGVYSYSSGWPDGSGQGCYMHTFADLGGYPGDELDRTYCPLDTTGFEWTPPETDPLIVTTGVFYIAFEQIGNYPSCDSVYVDPVAGTHNWTCYRGSWGRTTLFGDFLLRCYWDDQTPAVEETTWGRVKALY